MRACTTLAAIAVAVTVLTGCTSTAPPSPAPTASDPAGAPSGIVPEPGRTLAPDLERDGESLPGYRIAVVVGDRSPVSQIMGEAARQFAEERGADYAEFAALTPDDEGVATALSTALQSDADVVVGLGEPVVDVFSFETAQWLEQEFLVVGAQLAEPTANVTAVIWDGATSRGSAAASDGALEPSATTADIAGDAVAAGVDSVRSGLTGVVLSLPRR